MRKNTKIAAGLMLAAFASSASATMYNIDAVLSGNDSNFGYSGFHDATGSNPMSGPGLASFDAAPVSGTYDDVSGAFNLVLNLNAVNGSGASGTVTLNGDLFFIAGDLNPTGTLSAVFSNPVGPLVNTDITFFDGGPVCCGDATQPPNAFDGSQMSLWGADFPLPTSLGLDLRIELSEVPVPAAVWLFGTGLLGLVGVARRRA